MRWERAYEIGLGPTLLIQSNTTNHYHKRALYTLVVSVQSTHLESHVLSAQLKFDKCEQAFERLISAFKIPNFSIVQLQHPSLFV